MVGLSPPKMGRVKIKAPIKMHGGKTYLAKAILELASRIPHDVYIEPFGGSGIVLLNKPPVTIDVYLDLNPKIVATMKVVQNCCSPLLTILNNTPYCEESFRIAVKHDKGWNGETFQTEEDIYNVAQFIIRNRMSRGGLGTSFAWSERQRGGQPGEMNAWQTFREGLPLTSKRLEKVIVLQDNTLGAMLTPSFNDPNALIYLDPPYLPETRTVKKAYDCEMSREEHEVFLELCQNNKSSIILSGYANELYDTKLADWTRYEIDMPNHSSQSKEKARRTEILWTNRNI